MKVIDLLNKIANEDEIPKKFRYEGKTFIYNDYLKEHFDEKEGRNSFNFTFDLTDYDVLNDEVEIIEDTPKEDKKIEDKARFQYSQIPSWFDIKELIKAVNENFEKHQQALNEIIDKINGE